MSCTYAFAIYTLNHDKERKSFVFKVKPEWCKDKDKLVNKFIKHAGLSDYLNKNTVNIIQLNATKHRDDAIKAVELFTRKEAFTLEDD